jgi:hypothetical protein
MLDLHEQIDCPSCSIVLETCGLFDYEAQQYNLQYLQLLKQE